MVGTAMRSTAIYRRARLVTVAALALIAAACPATAQNKPPLTGLASYYEKNYAGKTAAGDRYDGAKLTAAHRTLPFGTRLVVTDRRSKRSVTVTVNDRGPFVKGRILDLSYAAATALRMQARGVITVSAVVE
jgi:rare lipoprotein A